MSLLLNRAKETTATTGTGTVTFSGAVSPFQTFAGANAVNGKSYPYLIEDGLAWEIGVGVYSSAGAGSLTRVLTASSSGGLLTLSGTATISCIMRAEDFISATRMNLIYSNAAITNPTTNIDIDVSDYDEILVMGRLVTLAATGFRGVFPSPDGTTFYKTTGDYVAVAQVGTEATTFIGGNHETSSNLGRTFGVEMKGLRSTSPKYMRGIVASAADRIFVATFNPITHIRIAALAASAGALINMTGGSLYVFAR